MINCRTCKFEVKPTMRHSLVKNCCPACGGALLGEIHNRRLSLFRQKLSNQAFSEKLDSDDIFDVALFMLIEFFPPDVPDVGSSPKDVGTEADAKEPSVAETSEPSAEEASPPAEEETYEAIRDQVRAEILNKNEDLSSEVLDADLKVQRLKRLAKESKVRTPGTFVRRLSGD